VEGLKAPRDESEVQITYVQSKNGKPRSIPVWFTLNQGKIELLPMYGARTKWFIDVEKSGQLELKVGDWQVKAKPTIIRETKQIDEIKGTFAAKYGLRDVKRYYPKTEVALEIPL